MAQKIDTNDAAVNLTIGPWTVYVDVANDANEPHPIVSAWKDEFEDDTALNLTSSVSFRVYNQEHTPATGGTDYFDVPDEDTAIRLTKKLNACSGQKWVWA